MILLGPPGAGKGTHAGPLSLYLGIPHISTGELFRENIRGGTPVGKQAQGYIDRGNLVPDAIVLEILFARTAQADCKDGYILDGFPRTQPQAAALDRQIGATHTLIALNIHVPDLFLIERITGRLACRRCGKPYHRKNDPPKRDGICNFCEGELYQRSDDREDILRQRLTVYRKESQPLIDYYASKGSVLRQIDGQNGKEQVFQDILDSLPSVVAPAR